MTMKGSVHSLQGFAKPRSPQRGEVYLSMHVGLSLSLSWSWALARELLAQLFFQNWTWACRLSFPIASSRQVILLCNLKPVNRTYFKLLGCFPQEAVVGKSRQLLGFNGVTIQFCATERFLVAETS